MQQAFVETGAVQCGFCTPGPRSSPPRTCCGASPSPGDAEIREALAGNLCRCTGYEKILDAVRLASARGLGVSGGVLIEGCAIADGGRGRDRARRGLDPDRRAAHRRPRRRARRPPPPGGRAAHRRARACLATPGLVNCHHHLYQWATRGMAQDEDLFGWLTALYPRLGRASTRRSSTASARGGLAALAVSGCATTHRPPLPLPARRRRPAGGRDPGGRGARPALPPLPRARWTSGASAGGLPPDEVVEDRDAVLVEPPRPRSTAGTTPRPESMLRIAVAPCSPFSVTGELMTRGGRARAPARGAAAHPPGRDRRGGGLLPRALRGAAGRVPRRPRLAGPGRLAGALRAPVARRGRPPRRDRHLGGALPVLQRAARAPASRPPPTSWPPGSRWASGVDGAASNESGELAVELRQALLVARLRGGPRPP